MNDLTKCCDTIKLVGIFRRRRRSQLVICGRCEGLYALVMNVTVMGWYKGARELWRYKTVLLISSASKIVYTTAGKLHSNNTLMRRPRPRPRVICEHNIESQRTKLPTLLEQKRRILGAQTATNRDRPNTRRNSTWRRINNIAVSWLHHRRRVRRTRSWTRLLRICRFARHGTSVDIISRECEFPAAEEYKLAWCL